MATHEGSYRYACQPAATVVRALGGVRRAAALLGVSAETCSQWNRPVDKHGTGGYVPQRFWDAILAQRPLGVTRELLESGRKEKAAMGSMSRRKGAAFERQVTNDLKELGLDARKVPLSGALADHPGDVEVHAPTGRWILQCKISADGGGRHGVMRMLAQVTMGYVRAAGQEFVALRRAQFALLLQGRPPHGLNLPTIDVAGKAIVDHVSGHDALVFRRSGVTEWMAIVPRERFEGVK